MVPSAWMVRPVDLGDLDIRTATGGVGGRLDVGVLFAAVGENLDDARRWRSHVIVVVGDLFFVEVDGGCAPGTSGWEVIESSSGVGGVHWAWARGG